VIECLTGISVEEKSDLFVINQLHGSESVSRS